MNQSTRRHYSRIRHLFSHALASGALALRILGTLCLGFSAAAAGAAGESFPSKPITLVVPFAAGGSLDLTGRVVAEKMRDLLGQPVVVLNKPGAGSSVGARTVAEASPDGYTIFIASGSAYGFAHLLVPGYTFLLKDFAPIAGIATNTSLFAVNEKIPVKTLPELLDYTQKNPGKVSFCSTGTGGLNHLQLEQLRGILKKQGRPIELTHIPYNGVAPALKALEANEVQACTLPFSSLVKNMDGKGIRIIAVMSPKRLQSIAQVPTTGEEGFPELDGNDALVNIVAPAGTPQTVLSKLEDTLRKSMKDPQVHAKLEKLDVQPTFVDRASTTKWLKQDVQKFEGIIRNAGLAVSQ